MVHFYFTLAALSLYVEFTLLLRQGKENTTLCEKETEHTVKQGIRIWISFFLFARLFHFTARQRARTNERQHETKRFSHWTHPLFRASNQVIQSTHPINNILILSCPSASKPQPTCRQTPYDTTCGPIGIWSGDWLTGWFAGWLAGWLADWLVRWLAGRLAGCLAGWLAGCLGCRFAG